LRIAPGRLPQSILIGGVPESEKQRVITGNCAFTTEGLGITPGTRNGKDMSAAQDLLATAVASVVGKKEERAIASLFTPGGTHAMKGEFQGINDFEVVAFLVVLPEKDALPEASGT